jgi:hypothetical protein
MAKQSLQKRRVSLRQLHTAQIPLLEDSGTALRLLTGIPRQTHADIAMAIRFIIQIPWEMHPASNPGTPLTRALQIQVSGAPTAITRTAMCPGIILIIILPLLPSHLKSRTSPGLFPHRHQMEQLSLITHSVNIRMKHAKSVIQ